MVRSCMGPILRALYWVNPFLTIFQKQFRADMEDVCDRVCIQSSGENGARIWSGTAENPETAALWLR